ncbi:unnamed protein product [Cylindrotheca closterium]|uniref:N-acetyltransferase domain-containing protein n=1 Tax=Cylindrotheca closterium TaxID=2856 RepID=A0AAD2GC33_9STRA|nr:unnamed protein product [Cylindrotheca closterium]
MATTTTLLVLGPEYIEECAQVMANAFSDAAIYRYIFRGTQESRRAALEWLFVRNIRIVLDKCPQALRGVLNNEKNSNQVVCCFMWVPQEHQDASLGEMLWHGLLQMPIRFGMDSVKRMLHVMDNLKSPSKEYTSQMMNDESGQNNNNIVKEGSIQLQRMVVRPDCQGQGLGTKALMAAIVEESAKGKLNLHLETQSPRNVTFYERLGYKVIWDKECYEEEMEYKFHSWCMIRSDAL